MLRADTNLRANPSPSQGVSKRSRCDRVSQGICAIHIISPPTNISEGTFMQRKLLALAALAFISGAASAATNVALGGTVTLSGATFGDSGGWCCGSLAAASTVTDGAVLPLNQQWNVDTVFWTGNAPSITVELAGA